LIFSNQPNQPDQLFLIPKRNTQVAGCKYRIAVEGDILHAFGGFLERDVTDGRRIEGDHAAGAAFGQGANGRSAKP
jgi:hypothetical protein